MSKSWLQRFRFTRSIVALLLGKKNADNLCGENKNANRFERHAKRVGATVVSCNLSLGYQRDLDGMIYPLTYSEEKQGEEQQNEIPLMEGLGLNSDGGDQAGTTNDREGVPPLVHLKPGERITHVLVKLENPEAKAIQTKGDTQ